MANQFSLLHPYLQDIPFELISVHIPKTAGTSFLHTLREVYTADELMRLDMGPKVGVKINQQPFIDEASIPSALKAMHGHYRVKEIVRMYPDNAQNIPLITWVRDPVERVVSNYRYLAKRLAEELNEKGKNLNILTKMQKTLLQYARQKRTQNMMSKILRGYPLEQFKFVGIQEYYEEDLKYLARVFNWSSLPVYQHNITGTLYEVSQEERKEIKSLNALDNELYQEALALRQQRVNK